MKLLVDTFVQTDFDVDLTEQIAQLRREKSAIELEYDCRLTTIKRSLLVNRSLLIHRSQVEKKRARRIALTNRLRLGHYQSERRGISLVQHWIDGSEFLDRRRRREDLVEQRKKDLGKAKTDDVLRLRQVALKREDEQVADDLHRLTRERDIHRREFQRIEDEDRSSFKHWKLLHHRYLLLALIHKGTNSELHRAFDFREQSDVLCQIHLRPADLPDEEYLHRVQELNERFARRQSLQHPRSSFVLRLNNAILFV